MAEIKGLWLDDNFYKKFMSAAKHFNFIKPSGKTNFSAAVKDCMRKMIEKHQEAINHA